MSFLFIKPNPCDGLPVVSVEGSKWQLLLIHCSLGDSWLDSLELWADDGLPNPAGLVVNGMGNGQRCQASLMVHWIDFHFPKEITQNGILRDPKNTLFLDALLRAYLLSHLENMWQGWYTHFWRRDARIRKPWCFVCNTSIERHKYIYIFLQWWEMFKLKVMCSLLGFMMLWCFKLTNSNISNIFYLISCVAWKHI